MNLPSITTTLYEYAGYGHETSRHRTPARHQSSRPRPYQDPDGPQNLTNPGALDYGSEVDFEEQTQRSRTSKRSHREPSDDEDRARPSKARRRGQY
jgi:hypothetical protein